MDPTEVTIPISDRTAYLSRVHVGVTIPVLALTLVPFVARLYVRTRPTWRMGWDDGFIIVGFMLAITDWALLKPETFMEPTLLTFPVATEAMKLAYLAIPVWSCAMTCIKVSASLTLLRLPIGAWWKAFLYVITGLQIAYFVGNTVYVFVACIPLEGIWDFRVSPTARCLGPKSSRIASNIGCAINISTDVLLSLTPMLIVWNMRRSLREKILVCSLTGIGLLASMSSFVKAMMVRKWGDPGIDTWAVAISIATWTVLEQFLAVMATCSPALKAPLQRGLKSVGVFITSYNSRVSFLDIRRSRLVTALKKEDGDEGRNTGLHVPAPVHFHSDETIKTHFTLSRGRSQSDLESGSSGISHVINHSEPSTINEDEKAGGDSLQPIASTTPPP